MRCPRTHLRARGRRAAPRGGVVRGEEHQAAGDCQANCRCHGSLAGVQGLLAGRGTCWRSSFVERRCCRGGKIELTLLKSQRRRRRSPLASARPVSQPRWPPERALAAPAGRYTRRLGAAVLAHVFQRLQHDRSTYVSTDWYAAIGMSYEASLSVACTRRP